MVGQREGRARAAAVGVIMSVALLSANAAAQDGANGGGEALACETGALGAGGEYVNATPQADGVTRAVIAFQCGGFLADGTYVPQGYRTEVFHRCAAGECAYPFAFAEPTPSDPSVYGASVFEEDTRIVMRLRMSRADRLVLALTQVDRDSRERERQRYVLDPATE